jgi:hypothetical protein
MLYICLLLTLAIMYKMTLKFVVSTIIIELLFVRTAVFTKCETRTE